MTEDSCCFCSSTKGALIRLYQGWCCVPCFKRVILGGIDLDSVLTEMAERKCENCNNYTKNGVCKLDGAGKSPLEDCNEFSINKHRRRTT